MLIVSMPRFAGSLALKPWNKHAIVVYELQPITFDKNIAMLKVTMRDTIRPEQSHHAHPLLRKFRYASGLFCAGFGLACVNLNAPAGNQLADMNVKRFPGAPFHF